MDKRRKIVGRDKAGRRFVIDLDWWDQHLSHAMGFVFDEVLKNTKQPKQPKQRSRTAARRHI